MTTAAIVRSEPHPATAAIESLMAAAKEAPHLEARLTGVAEIIAALYRVIQHTDEDMRGLRDASLAAHREVTRLTSTNAALNEALNHANLKAADDQRDMDCLHAQLTDMAGDIARVIAYSDQRRTRAHHSDLPTPHCAAGAR